MASFFINNREPISRVSFTVLTVVIVIYLLLGQVSLGTKVLVLAKSLFYIVAGWIYGKNDLRDKPLLVFSCYVFIAGGFWVFINAMIAYVIILLTEFSNLGVKGSMIIQGISGGISFSLAGIDMLVKFYSN